MGETPQGTGGGSAALIEAIADSPELEAWRVEPADSLAVEADKVNGPPDRKDWDR